MDGQSKCRRVVGNKCIEIMEGTRVLGRGETAVQCVHWLKLSAKGASRAVILSPAFYLLCCMTQGSGIGLHQPNGTRSVLFSQRHLSLKGGLGMQSPK